VQSFCAGETIQRQSKHLFDTPPPPPSSSSSSSSSLLLLLDSSDADVWAQMGALRMVASAVNNDAVECATRWVASSSSSSSSCATENVPIASVIKTFVTAWRTSIGSNPHVHITILAETLDARIASALSQSALIAARQAFMHGHEGNMRHTTTTTTATATNENDDQHDEGTFQDNHVTDFFELISVETASSKATRHATASGVAVAQLIKSLGAEGAAAARTGFSAASRISFCGVAAVVDAFLATAALNVPPHGGGGGGGVVLSLVSPHADTDLSIFSLYNDALCIASAILCVARAGATAHEEVLKNMTVQSEKGEEKNEEDRAPFRLSVTAARAAARLTLRLDPLRALASRALISLTMRNRANVLSTLESTPAPEYACGGGLSSSSLLSTREAAARVSAFILHVSTAWRRVLPHAVAIRCVALIADAALERSISVLLSAARRGVMFPPASASILSSALTILMEGMLHIEKKFIRQGPRAIDTISILAETLDQTGSRVKNGEYAAHGALLSNELAAFIHALSRTGTT
jgi:hypothetical protein